VASGEVLLEISLYDPFHTSATSQHIHQKLMGITAADNDVEEDDEDLERSISRIDSLELDDDDDDEESALDEPPEDAKDETVEKKRRRLRLARLRKKAKQRAYEFSGLSDLDGVLFLEIGSINDLPPERNGMICSLRLGRCTMKCADYDVSFTNIFRHGSVCCYLTWEEDLQNKSR